MILPDETGECDQIVFASTSNPAIEMITAITATIVGHILAIPTQFPIHTVLGNWWPFCLQTSLMLFAGNVRY